MCGLRSWTIIEPLMWVTHKVAIGLDWIYTLVVIPSQSPSTDNILVSINRIMEEVCYLTNRFCTPHLIGLCPSVAFVLASYSGMEPTVLHGRFLSYETSRPFLSQVFTIIILREGTLMPYICRRVKTTMMMVVLSAWNYPFLPGPSF